MTSPLAARVAEYMSEARFSHTMGVVQEVSQMAKLYCKEKEEMLKRAALLHDLTKEYTNEQTMAVLSREGVTLREDEAATPAIHHAITAPFEILRLFPEEATDELLSAVRYHTTGRAKMTLTEAILYLADVIERGREYPACVRLRERFWGVDLVKMTTEEKQEHLVAVLLESLEGVRESILARRGVVCLDTEAAIEYLRLTKTLL